MYYIWQICIGILPGFLAGKIMRGCGFGLLGAILPLYIIRLIK